MLGNVRNMFPRGRSSQAIDRATALYLLRGAAEAVIAVYEADKALDDPDGKWEKAIQRLDDAVSASKSYGQRWGEGD